MKRKEMNEILYRNFLERVTDSIREYCEKKSINFDDLDELTIKCPKINKISLSVDEIEFLISGFKEYGIDDYRILKFIDLSGFSFDGKDVSGLDFSGTNANIDPQTVKGKNLTGTNLYGLDMSGKCFDECIIINSNLSYTNATIDPQKVYKRDLSGAKLEHLSFYNYSFDNVIVKGASFKSSIIDRFDPQKVFDKDLSGTTLSFAFFDERDFQGCNLQGANLKDIISTIVISSMDDLINLYGCDLTGVRLLVGSDITPSYLREYKITYSEDCLFKVLNPVNLNTYDRAKKDYIPAYQKIRDFYRNSV